MYWCDGKSGLIEKANIDGTNRRVLSDQFGDAHFFGLAFDRKRLYYTDWSRSYVMELSIRSGMHYQLGTETFSRLNGIYFHKGGPYVQESTGCTYKRGGCSHICLPRPKGNVKCLCPDGMSLQNDDKECEVDPQDTSEPLRLLVIGKVGVGKSTVGNVLIGRKVFAVPLVFSNEPGTLKSTAVEATNFLGQHVRIIDTPGVYGSNQEEKTIKNEIAKGLRLAKPGPHALLFVTRIGKFTTEDEKAIEFYERNFGSQVTKYIVVVFTGKEKLVGEGINIHDYVKSLNPKSKLKNWIEKTEHRYVAFSDTGYILDQKKNVESLLDMIGRMMLKNLASPYFGDTEDAFIKHEKDKYKP
ncbi:GTPase IMAP family member 6-like [Saccostrea cucullata]|uniref:GTPase IMAP family member 6-like n=1 Tax=Saccostrea cuccullata TaxID=36930 RepID=UPI002ED19ADE